MSTPRRIVLALLLFALAGGGAIALRRGGSDRPESRLPAPGVASVPAKSQRMPVPGAPAATRTAVARVIAGRVTGLSAGATARVEARRTGDFPPPERTRRRPVEIEAPSRSIPPSAVADTSDGTFALPLAASGSYVVTVTSPDGREASTDVELPEPMVRTEVEIALPPGEEVLRGRVVRADGAPFRGWVVLRPRNGDAADRAIEPGADGRFEFRGLDRGSVSVEAIVPGVVSVSARAVDVPASEETVLTISAGPLRRGRVVADPEGTPIAGASVLGQVEVGDGYEATLSVTDAAGVFEMSRTERTHVSVEAPGFWYASTVIEGPGPDEIVLRLERTCVVTGRVRRSSDGSLVAGAVVVAPAPATSLPWRRASSAPDGSYRLDGLAPGVWHDVYVLGGGWASVKLVTGAKDFKQQDPFVIKLPAGAEETVDLYVEPSARITGRVAGPSGDPVRAARVELQFSFRTSGPVPELDWDRTAWTGADGAFEFADLPGATDFRVEATAPGFSPNGADGKLTSGETQTAEIRLAPPRRLEVLVLAAQTGEPVAMAEFELERLTDAGPVRVENGPHFTDAKGRCVIQSVPAGRLGVTIDESGFVPTPYDAPVAAVQDAADPGVCRVEVRLEPTLAVEGTLLRADGTPAAGVTLFVKLPGKDPDNFHSRRMVETDEDGAFRLADLPAGTYLLRMIFNSAADLSSVVAGTTGVVVRMPPAEPDEPRVECTLAGPAGERIDRARVEHCRPGRSGDARFDGRVISFPRDESGPGWYLAIYKPHDDEGRPLPFGATLVALPATLPDPFEVRLDRERVVTGRVVGFDGRGAPNVPLHVEFSTVDVEDYIAEATTGADGAFEIRGLGDGAFRVVVSLPPDQAKPPPLVVHGGDTDVVLNLRSGAGGVVTVADSDGRPVRGATVEVRAVKPQTEKDAKPLARLVTGADGKVRVNGLASGVEVALVVTGPSNRDDLAARTISPWDPRDADVRLERAVKPR